MDGLSEVELAVLGVVRDTDFVGLTELEVWVVQNQHFCHRCLLHLLLLGSIHSIYYICSIPSTLSGNLRHQDDGQQNRFKKSVIVLIKREGGSIWLRYVVINARNIIIVVRVSSGGSIV